MSDHPLRIRAQSPSGDPLQRAARPAPCVLVLFGVTGDLAGRKIVPALYELAREGSLPEPTVILGLSRSARSDKQLREFLRGRLEDHAPSRPLAPETWERLARHIFAVSGGVREEELYTALRQKLEEVEGEFGTQGRRLVYLATPPSLFPSILQGLARAGITHHASEEPGAGWSRVIVEKPFGHDLASARALNALVLEGLDEQQVFRIDHYLGKETVQNILVLRFANTIFEPLWNRSHVDHVQITMAEDIGVDGRGSFYEETGVVRDVVQNHLVQMLALAAMEPPISFEADEVRGMKSQLFRSLRPLQELDLDQDVVFGQYEGYHAEDGVPAESKRATYVAMRAWIDNWRWQGVPFYLRAGKGLGAKRAEISFHFRTIPFCLFGEEKVCQLIEPNVLRLRVQPDEGASLRIASKVPGADVRVGSVDMDFDYGEVFDRPARAAYERLLLDCMRGDATLFARRDEVEESWRWIEPLIELDRQSKKGRVARYERGSSGPQAAKQLLARDGRRWESL